MIMAIMLMTILVVTYLVKVGGCWGDGSDDNLDENCQDNDDSHCDLVKVGGWTCGSGATLGGVVQSASLVNIYSQHFFRRIKLQQKIGNNLFPNLTRPEKMVEEPLGDQL